MLWEDWHPLGGQRSIYVSDLLVMLFLSVMIATYLSDGGGLFGLWVMGLRVRKLMK